MLQRNMLQTEGPHAQLGGAVQSNIENGGIGELVTFALAFLRRQYLVVLITAALAMAACVAYLRITPPTYTAQVQILLASPRAQFIQQQSLLADPAINFNEIETQIQLLKSRAIAVAVINQLKLDDDPDLYGPMPLLPLLWYHVGSWFLPAPPKIQPVETTERPSEGAIKAFQDRLSATRVGMSNVIEVSFNWNSSGRAAEIANETAKAYIADQLNAKFDANRSATTWLQERLRDLDDKALTAERAVNAYKSENNIVSPDGKSIDDQQVTELSSRLVAARTQTSDALAKLNRYEAILSANSQKSVSLGNLDAGGNDALNSPIINNLRQQYLELARRESEWSARFGRDHLAVINLHTRMQDLRTSIFAEVSRLAETSRSEYEVAKQRQQEVEKQLADAISRARSTNSAELTIRELESRAKELRSLNDTFLQRYVGAVQQETFPITETRVIYPAAPPQSKSKPKTNIILALGAFGGLALGIGLGLLRDLMDRVFRTSAQVETALELPCVSMVPLLAAPKPDKAAASSGSTGDDLKRQIITPRLAVHNAIVNMPLSRFAEALRSVKLAIDLNAGKAANQVVGITSSLPNEGKTTIAASLGQLIAHSGKKVILVDCDLRNPSLSANLAPNAGKGIIEVINGDCSLDDTVWEDPKTKLAFLPVVRHSPLLHTSEILATETMRALFVRLRATYDYVIVDLPPLAPVVDVRTTTPLVDGFVLVIEWGRTKIDVVRHALHTAPNLYDNLVGVVLNKTNIRSMARYDSHHSDYYSDAHHARYGFVDVDLKAR